jgi:hypothetical protein
VTLASQKKLPYDLYEVNPELYFKCIQNNGEMGRKYSSMQPLMLILFCNCINHEDMSNIVLTFLSNYMFDFQGIKRLYPQHFDRRRELRKLNHSLLVNFLDLLDLLVQCPDSPRRAEKVEDLSLLFIHIHHLLNEFRPHQARETLRVMMELQRRQRIETAQRFQKHLDKVREIFRTIVLIIIKRTGVAPYVPSSYLCINVNDTNMKYKK